MRKALHTSESERKARFAPFCPRRDEQRSFRAEQRCKDHQSPSSSSGTFTRGPLVQVAAPGAIESSVPGERPAFHGEAHFRVKRAGCIPTLLIRFRDIVCVYSSTNQCFRCSNYVKMVGQRKCEKRSHGHEGMQTQQCRSQNSRFPVINLKRREFGNAKICREGMTP